jgi:hypothetical protein
VSCAQNGALFSTVSVVLSYRKIVYPAGEIHTERKHLPDSCHSFLFSSQTYGMGYAHIVQAHEAEWRNDGHKEGEDQGASSQ